MLKIKLSELKKLEWNPRTIKKEDLDKLTKSIEKFWVIEWRPFLVSNRTGENIIIWGNQRYEVCKKLGIKEVPVHIMEWLSEEEEKEIIIRDNISNWEWDWDILANEWDKEELEEWWLDVQFETVEPEAEEDDFEVDEGIKTDIVLWDLFEIGEHRLLCWDSTNIDDVNKLMNGEKADMVFTDPPYWIEVKNTRWEILWDWNLDVFRDSVSIIPAYCWENVHTYIFFWSKLCKESLEILNWIYKQYNLLIMPITNQTQPYPEWYFSSNYEICYFTHINWVSKHRSWIIEVSETTKKDGRYDWDWFLKKYYALWDLPITEHNVNCEHPTQKKVEWISFYIKISSDKNNLVLDLFWWSGSTMVACHQLNRKCYMSELDPKYVQTIINRMIKLDSTLEIKRNWEHYKSVISE